MVSEHPLAMPSETPAAMGDRDRSESAPPLLHNNYGTTVFHAPNGADVPRYDYRFGVDPRLPRQLRKGGNWSPGVLPGDGGGRGVNLGANGSGLFMDDGFGRVTGLDTGTHNDLGEIFQGSLSYPNPSPTGGLNSNISSTNITASSNGLDPDASNNYGSILGSPLSKNGSPDPEIAMRVPSPCLPPIGVKLTSSNRRMVTNGSSTFSNASFGLDINDQMISAISALNLQGANASHSFIGGQADSGNIIGSYAELDRSNVACSPISRNFTHLQESNACTKMHMHGAPFMFQQTGNGGCTSPDTSLQQLYLLEYIKKYEDGGPMRKMTRQHQIMQQLCSPSADHGFAYGYMPDFAFPSLPTGDQIGSGDYSMMGFLPNLRKLGSFSNHIPTLLEEFKSNKTGCYELSDIVGHVVEFSMDQHGSRFIQQKLETASTAEKDMVFSELMPQAITLMTDVFGNYVVQKFFEHGSPAQIKKLATKLNGRVLSLSLQMYGCRVIQKAIEVVDLEQQTQMVAELENSVMRCVHDQNGNHVIQKCIECVPQDVIHFIISTFYGHVVSLSTHSYGCRVIQRVLEHCDNPKTQEIMMNEILGDVMFLSQDQYGNYVVQHVLEHGKPHEKSAIIGTLAGQILNMSRQKYASNVVEKCLTFGSQAERQILIREMLGPTEENEALQEMMKDQFGNYVVQKVLETCSDTQREMILTRIKIHLTALKKYTYGKHIVARVEKLVAAGERRLGIQPGAFVSTA